MGIVRFLRETSRNVIRQMSYRNKILVGFVVLTIVPIAIIGTYSYALSTRLLEDQASNSILQTMQQIDISISKRLGQINEVSNLILNNQQIQNIVFNPKPGTIYEQIEDYNHLTSYFTDLEKSFQIFRIRLFIDSDPVYANESHQIFPLEELHNRVPSLELSKENDRLLNWKSTYMQHYSYGQDIFVFSAFHTLISMVNPDKHTGVYFIDITEDELEKTIQAVGAPYENYKIVIIDNSGNVVYSKNKTLLSKKLGVPYLEQIMQMESGNFDGNNSLVSVRKMSGTNWRIIIDVPLKDIRNKSGSIGVFSILIAIMSIAAVILLGVLISNSLTRRIRNLMTAMEAGRGELRKRLLTHVSIQDDLIGGDEIDDLIDTYNKMTQRINSLVEEVYRVKIEESEAKLKALQAQINPHFLYNILGSVKSCLDGNKNQDASEMVVSLARFFQIVLSKGVDKIPIEEEIEMIIHYIRLQEMVYKDEFTWTIEVDEDIKPFLITKFTLQPIVENAINHGIRKEKLKGRIWIRGYFHEDHIKLEVIDNGFGMGSEELARIRESIKGEVQMHKRGYGLRNVNSRLKLHWGSKYGISIESSEGSGTAVTVTIPQDV